LDKAENDVDSVIMPQQIRTISKSRLKARLGQSASFCCTRFCLNTFQPFGHFSRDSGILAFSPQG